MAIKNAFKQIIRSLLDILKPVYALIFKIIPIQLLIYIAGTSFGIDTRHPVRHRLAVWFIGGGHIPLAKSALSQRMLKMSDEEKRNCTKSFWKSSSTTAWGQRAFTDSNKRCQHSSFQLVHDWWENDLNKKPLRILELGTMNGGSFHCLEQIGVEIELFCGVDISKDLINEARTRFKDRTNVEFIESDFQNYIEQSNKVFDLVFDRWTFFYLDQQYFEGILATMTEKKMTSNILISELKIDSHIDVNSKLMSSQGTPLEYSHNYTSLLSKYSYETLHDHSHPSNKDGLHEVEAIFKRKDT